MANGEAMSAERVEDFRRRAQEVIEIARQHMQIELKYDMESVAWMAGYIERNRLGNDERSRQGMINMLGLFLGECLIRNVGGYWAQRDGMVCVQFDDASAAFPFNKVAKQMDNGLEGGDSVLGFYQTIVAMRAAAKPPTVRQERLLKFHRDGGNRIFILRIVGKQPEWREVTGIKDGWVAIQDSVSPRLSVPLTQIESFYVCAPDGKLVHAEQVGKEHFDSLSPGILSQLRNSLPVNAKEEAAKPSPDASHYITPTPAQPVMEQAIVKLRDAYAPIQKRLNPNILKSVCASAPAWMKENDGLYEILHKQSLLLTEGTITWGALIQANKLLFEPGKTDSPGLLVHSIDPYFDARPLELSTLGHKIFGLKGTNPADPALKKVADLVSDEMDRSMGFKLPAVFSNKEISAAAFMVFRKHIPNGVLNAGIFPILTHPSTQAVMIVPFEFWPIEMILVWKKWSG